MTFMTVKELTLAAHIAASPLFRAMPAEVHADAPVEELHLALRVGAAVDAALGAVRGVPGVQGASTTSLAMGGTSVMRVSYEGDLGTLADALRARGWRVTVGANALSIRR